MTLGEETAAGLSLKEGEKRWRRFGWLLYPFMKVSFLPFGGESNFARKTVAFAAPQQGENVLDACCGAGALTTLIAARVGKTGSATGIDISEKAIKKASKKTRRGLSLAFRQASAAAIPFPDNNFDKVFISFGLHEMDEADRIKSLNEAKRVLKDEGSLFVLEYNLSESFIKRFAVKVFNWLFESRSAYSMLIAGKLPGYLEQTGFNIKRRQTTGAEIFQILHTVKAPAEKKNA